MLPEAHPLIEKVTEPLADNAEWRMAAHAFLGEKHWLAQETLLRIDPDAPDLGAYEFKIAAQQRKEINAITGVK
jgi:hypothetical protein